ncbi:GNAT family N-acetyltransferase [Blastococcus sp. TBT05-19]|uniref:GNAT family N-acetyltransferase n=1 Tax=Blastococcus sp. TBT05-19 TaxID=2250581 RepID=UPI001F178F8C|nr:GNAT family N-acetyltransferase [Blastococcus sp. TBT05-19]
MARSDGYEFDDDLARVDVDAVWAFLSEHVYWGRWRSRADFDRQLAASWRVVACYEQGTGATVGFARAVSDGVGFAYLGDVFVLPAHRGRGLGVRLVEEMVERGPGAGFRWLLHTDDAGGLYERFGFAPASTVMERRHGTERADGEAVPESS